MAAPANNPFGAPPAQTLHNPFAAPSSGQSKPMPGAAAQNPFGAPPANPFGAPSNNPFGAPASGGSKPSSAGKPFGAPSGQTSAFGSPAASAPQSTTTAPGRQPSPSVQNPFGKPQSQAADANTMARRSKTAAAKATPPPNSSGFGGRGQKKDSQRATPFAGAKSSAKQANGQTAAETSKRPQPGGKNKKPERPQRSQPLPRVNGDGRNAPIREPSERTRQLSTFAYDYANKLYDHLRKENIHPPQWPPEPGNPHKRAAIENLKEAYKKYRARVYASLRKADLIDDPEKRRKLEDALPFKGICEDMCPEFEQVCRIAEYDVKTEEKETRPDGLTMWPDPARMVKKFGRSAAGQDAPLPMDVRSVDALRRTTDYLFNDLLQSESNLPSMHNFLWDRTRAVRRDFTFHSQKSADEMKDMVYCFETIARFHAVALHLLSKKGFANEDFDQKQEIEQLGRTILSLVEAYDVCRDMNVACENEAEFRAYYLLLNAHDPSIVKRIPSWGKEYWFGSDEVQTALSLVQAMDDVRELKGPIKPRRPTTLSDTSFTNYFAIVEDPRVSYTMACVAEIHFTTVRQGILRNLVRGYARHRDAPRTITASELNAMLRFDTDQEAVEFAELHGFEFSTWVPEGRNPVTEPYLLLNNKKKVVPSPRVRQSFSGKLVERKRTTQSLPYVIYNTIFEEPAEKPLSAEDSPGSLFVSQAAPSGDSSSSAAPSAAAQTAKPGLTFGTSPSPSPFGSAAQNTPLPNGILSSQGPAGNAAPAFARLQASQTSSSAAPNNPFGAPGQPNAQAQTGKSPFSFQPRPPAPSSAAGTNIFQPSSSTILGQPAQTEQKTTTTIVTTATTTTTSSPFTTPKRPETQSPFSFLKDAAKAPPVSQTTQQPAITFPPKPSPFGSTGAPQPTAAPTPAQDVTSTQTGTTLPPPAPAATSLGGVSPLSTTAPAKPAKQQLFPAAPAIPSISISPPSAGGKPEMQRTQSTPFSTVSQVPAQSPFSALPAPQTTSVSAASGPAAVSAPSKQPPKRDLMGDFTKWFVKGDDGLMEHFIEETLRVLLWDVFQAFEREEAERKRREEDEQLKRIAREHQIYRLRVKYFYRWRDIARSLARKRILRDGKERMRMYREQQKLIQKQQQEEQERAEREARQAAERQLAEDSNRLSLLASSTRRRPSVAYSADHNPEEQLFASGIFSGLRDDPRAVARRVVHEAVNGDGWASATSRSFRYPESELELEPARSLRESSAASPDTSSVGRREGWKTRSLREKFGLDSSRRRSLSASGSVVNGPSSASRFRQSLPGHRTTNFSRKRSAGESSDDEPDPKRQSVFHHSHYHHKANGLAKSRHWELRARGFVPTPDGNWLPEAMARSGARDLAPPEDENNSNDDEHERALALPDADADADAASDAAVSARRVSLSPSPSPSDLRLRLARLKKSTLSSSVHGHGHGHGHGTRHSFDFAPSIATAAHPHYGPGIKRKRGLDVDGDGDVDVDVDADADANVHADDLEDATRGPAAGGTRKRKPIDVAPSVTPVAADAESTAAMVENTRRMLRELREFMDRLDRDEQDEAALQPGAAG